MKSLFSNKVRMNTRNKYEIANIFNTFFIEIVPDLGTKVDERYLFLTQLQKLFKNIKII